MFKTNIGTFIFANLQKKKGCKLGKAYTFHFKFLCLAVIVLNGCKIFIFGS